MTQNDANGTDWEALIEEANERYLEAFEQNVAAQASFVEAWMDALDETMEPDQMTEGLEGYAEAYATWMEAAEDQVERMNASLEGADVPPEEFRDRWLTAANEAFKDVMRTNAFAAATGDTIKSALEMKSEADEYAEDTLQSLGFATVSDVQEVGDRLVELERRQHRIEDQLSDVLEELRG